MDSCIAFCHLLKQASSVLEKQLATAMKGSGLTLAQAMLLLHVNEGSNSISSLSEDLCCSCGNVTQLADGLVKKDIVMQTQCKDDRRVQHLKMTAKGKKILGELSDKLKSQAHACLKAFPKEDQVKVTRVLASYVETKED